jgi:hypothetical protein
MLMGTRGLPGIKYKSIIPGQDRNGTVWFHIWVTDANGNMNHTHEFNINVIQKPQTFTGPNIYSVIPVDGANLRSDLPIKVVAKVNDSSGYGVTAVYLNYTAPGGINYNETMESIGNQSYTFKIPTQAEVGTLSFYVTAKNSLDIWNRTNIRVIYLVYVPPLDRDPPFVKSTIPNNESSDVAVDTEVIIVFNESMLPSSVVSAITIIPEMVYTLAWGGDEPNTELIIMFTDDLELNTTYKISIGPGARDIAENRMNRSFILTFQTIAPAGPSDKDWDKDNDGMNDTWEVKFGLDPLINDSTEDPDKDGYTNIEEYLAKTDPTDPKDHPKDESDGDDEEDKSSQYVQMVLGVIALIIIIAIIAIPLLVRRRKSQESTPTTTSTEQSEGLDEEPVPYELESEEDVMEKEKEYNEKDEYERLYGAVGSTYAEDAWDEEDEWDIESMDEESEITFNESEEIEWDDEE